MRSIYTLDIEDFTSDGQTPDDLGYRVTIYEHGEKIGDGVAYLLSLAIKEAFEQAGIVESEARA